jgi:uncharacterized protein
MQQSQSPLSPEERYEILDVLRGFALLGVMIDNLFGFTGWGFATEARRQSYPTWTADMVLGTLEQVFVNGKFYSLFSLLFGIGFSIILVRSEARGLDPVRLFLRRLFVLLLIGSFHLLFLWEGDILFLYALIGFVLPLFRRLPDRSLLVIAICLILSPILIDLLSVCFHYRPGEAFNALGARIDNGNGVPSDQEGYSQYLYRKGSGWAEWRNWQASGWAYRIGYLLQSNRIPKVLAMFLLGLYIGRKMIYAQLEAYQTLLKKLLFGGLLVGIPMGLLSFYFEFFLKGIPDPEGLVHTVAYAFSVVPMSLAYASGICLYWLRKKGRTRLHLLAPVGQMALTNYLMQTLVAIFLYYGIGLGLGGNIGPSVFIPAGILVYICQISYSGMWMAKFRFGPMEWIWRQLTYGRTMPIRR